MGARFKQSLTLMGFPTCCGGAFLHLMSNEQNGNKSIEAVIIHLKCSHRDTSCISVMLNIIEVDRPVEKTSDLS